MNLEQQIIEIPIEDIIPNRFQPRLNFDDKGIEELANSIKEHGIIQPLVLRRLNDKYEIIAGERRYKAATLAGLKTVPGIIADIDDNKSAEVAIVENVQRRDLSAIEEARSYKNLLDKGYLTQVELAKKMGLSQSAIANKLRLLNLDDSVQEALVNNEISERHARSLLVLDSHEDQRKWLDRIIKERLTVRDLDALLKKETVADDVPLVHTPDIETIRKEATELPKINEQSDIAAKLREVEQEKRFSPDIVPVEQASNDAKNHYFNFLENERVNMNVEETDIKSPFDIEMPKVVEEPAETINEEMVESPVEEVKNVEEPPLFNFGPSLMEEEIKPAEEVFDPIDLIDTLDPEYEEKQEEASGKDLKTAIFNIRGVVDDLRSKGFNINIEETDMQGTYQFIIRVKD